MGASKSKYVPKYIVDISKLKDYIDTKNQNIILVSSIIYGIIKTQYDQPINILYNFENSDNNYFHQFGIKINMTNSEIKNIMETKNNNREIQICSHNCLENRIDDNLGKFLSPFINVHHNIQPIKLLSLIINHIYLLDLPTNIFIQGSWKCRNIMTIINICNLRNHEYDFNYNSYIFNFINL